MGISTIPSYCGAQIFEAVGLAPELVDEYFTGTASRIGGIGLDELARETLERHARAYPGGADGLLPVVGPLRLAAGGEHHQWNPETIALLQHAVAQRGCGDVRASTRGRQRGDGAPLDAARADAVPLPEDGGVPLEEVEPAREIVKRFATGAMSLGSLSREAHETLAVAMNRIGGRSNTGEGGEDPVRYLDRTATRRSAIKQVASGRFGVTSNYLANADELADQDGAGREAGRGRPAARAQGRPLHRGRPPDDAGRRPDLAAAAPRHLLDRGPEAADLRPPLREPGGADLGQARRRGRASAPSPRASRRRTPTTC